MQVGRELYTGVGQELCTGVGREQAVSYRGWARSNQAVSNNLDAGSLAEAITWDGGSAPIGCMRVEPGPGIRAGLYHVEGFIR